MGGTLIRDPIVCMLLNSDVSLHFRSTTGSATSASATRRISSKLKRKPTCTLPKPPQPPQVEAAPEAHPPHGAGHPSPAGVAVVVAAAPVAATGEAETLEGFSR